MGDYMATNYARASFSEVYDLSTEVDKPSFLGVHTPVSGTARRMLSGFFQQFKRFKYSGAKITMIPVATLPADPLMISYEAGETIDPRDLVNPILHKGMHGESLGAFLNSIMGDATILGDRMGSLDRIMISGGTGILDGQASALDGGYTALYYQALSDPSFRKSHIQKGFQRSGLVPLVYDVATNKQMNFAANNFGGEYVGPGSTGRGVTAEDAALGGAYVGGDSVNFGFENSLNNAELNAMGYSIANFAGMGYQMFTPHMSRLGWMDCDQVVKYEVDASTSLAGVGTTAVQLPAVQASYLPRLFMYFVMLPPAYKTEMYFRVVINHYFEFRDFRSSLGPFASNNYQPFTASTNPDNHDETYIPAVAVSGSGTEISPLMLTNEESLEVINGAVSIASAGVS